MKTIGIYPGNFQPPTKAHFQAYKRLRQVAGPDTFVVTTDRTPTPEAPLNVGDKEQIWVRHGVPASSIQKVHDWKRPEEVYHNFSADQTAAIYALNPKDAADIAKRKSRSSQLKNNPETDQIKIGDIEGKPIDKEVWLETDGELNYFQPHKGNENSMKPFSEHAYVMIVNDDKIDGRPVSTSNIRQVFGSPRYTEDAKKKFFRFVFGWFDVGLYTLILNKFRYAHQVAGEEEPPLPMETPPIRTPLARPLSPSFRENVTKMVNEILEEIMGEDTTTTTTDSSTTDMASALDKQKTPGQQAADKAKKLANINKEKQLATKDLATMKADVKWKEADLRTKRTITLKQQQDKIDTLNKQLLNPDSTSDSTTTSTSTY